MIMTRISQGLAALWALILMLCLVSTAQAQTFGDNNTANAAINDSVLCPTGTNASGAGVVGNITRTFTVTGLSNITDLNVGFLASHTWRGDIDMRLQSPTGTTQRLLIPDTTGAGNDDNYNILLDDEATIPVNTGAHDVANNTAAARYEFSVQPAQPLSVFDGQNPNGTWTMTICDDYTGETGTYFPAELIFTPSTGADLSLSALATPGTIAPGNSVTLDFTVSSAGPQNSTPTAQINLPAGLTFVSSAGDGSYNNTTGVWTIGSGLTPGTPRTLSITASAISTGIYTATAEILSSNRADPDSTPNNGVTTEDDYATATVSVQPSTIPPELSCPIAERFTHNWTAPGTTNGWTSGSLTNSYVANTHPIGITMTNNTNRFIPRNFNGTNIQTPVSNQQFATGANAGEYGVVMNVDYAATTENVLTTMTFGVPGEGLGAVQFQLLDIDLGTWTDQIIISGSLNGTPVSPILTPGTANAVTAADTFTGTAGSATGTSGGDTTITFQNSVDTVTFLYQNSNSAANPIAQVISLQKLVMCPPRVADVSAVKTVEVYDPSNLGLYMTPGNEVLYRITVTNSNTATAQADDIDISDTLPTNLRFVSATTTGFTGGAFGTPALPPANTDCGATPNPCVVRFSGATVPINATGEIIVRALIK
jgi:uncharacterized repeat protein (TIGR01451 family)